MFMTGYRDNLLMFFNLFILGAEEESVPTCESPDDALALPNVTSSPQAPLNDEAGQSPR